MLKQKIKNLYKYKKLLGVLAISAVIAGSTAIAGIARADQFDDQINTLQQQNAANQSQVNSLAAQANSYQSAIDALQSQIDAIQAAIVQTQHDIDDLTNQINQAQAQLDQQKKVLGEDIKTMYLQGQTSTLEILAASKNLNEFVDQQEYRYTVQNKIKTTVDKINSLKLQLQQQQRQQQDLLTQQQSQRDQLQSSQDQQSQMLTYTDSQKAAYTQQIQAANAQIAKLQAQKIAYYQQATGGGSRNFGDLGGLQFRSLSAQQDCGGGYDYCGYSFDQFVSDSWGLGLARECVHYAADRAAQGWNLAPYLGGGRGDAYEWPNSLSGVSGITIDRYPSPGSVAISEAVNHAMYVEYDAGGGWWGVSQMNFDGRGHYSTMEVNQSSLWFIHFNR